MSDKKVTAGTINEAGDALSPALEDTVYLPRAAQREIKSQYWHAWKEDPHVEAHLVTAADVAQTTNDSRIYNWWKVYGFKEWFLNNETFAIKTITNGERGLEIIQEIMDNEKLAPSLRLKAAQISIEALTKMREKSATIQFADKALNGMDSEKLEAEIKKLSRS